MSPEGRDEWGVLVGLFVDLVVATEVSAKSELHDEDGACLPVE
jgi:hypothetical protein